jgi:tetratricopeptide (TPR) repeat protein
MAANNDSHREPGNPEEFATTVTLPPMPAQPRSTRYKILKLQGRGGMGEVWLAHDEHIGRQVAFKRIRTGKAQLHERFLAEAQVTGQLEHPGIVPVHDLGRDEDNEPYYVMRLIQGRTLKEVIADLHAANKRSEPDEDLRWLRVLEVFVALCRTISFAHSRGVIHRDVKPDNVMVGPYGETMVLDWGLCKLPAHPEEMVTGSNLPVKRSSGGYGSSVTQDGEIIGSPLYMSPEMADGRIADEDDRTDVYLLGATLYEVLTNRPPRAGSSQQEIVELARTSPPVAPRKIAPRVPRALEAICLKAMAYRKDERYESAQQVGDEIQRYLAGEPVEAYPEPFIQRLWRWARFHRAAIARGALVAAVLTVAAVGVRAWQLERAGRAAAAAALAKLQTQERARDDAKTFRELAETLHYQLAETTPIDDRVDVTDPEQPEATWQKIQEIVERRQPLWADIPDENERIALQKDYAELVLWRTQALVAQALDTESAERLLADLESISSLRPSAYSYHRLRASCLLAAGKNIHAENSLALAQQVQKAPYDFFLEGEQKRMAAVAQVGQDSDVAVGRPSPTFLQDAAQLYQKCLDLDPQNFWAHLQKGRANLARDEIDQAIAEFNLAVAIRPESPTAWSVRGLANGILRRFPAAEHDLDYAVALKGHSPTALLNRGAVYLLQRKFPEAQKDFLAVKSQDSTNLPATYYLAQLRYQQADFANALRDCDAVLQRSPSLRPALLLRVQIDLATGDGAKALADMDLLSSSSKPADSSPAQAANRCQLLRVLAGKQTSAAGQRLALALAEEQGLKAVDGGVKTAALFDDLGAVQYKLGEFDANQARRETNQARRNAGLARGQARIAAAIVAYERGLACDASPAAIAALHRHLGLALSDRKEWDRAKQHYQKAIALGGSELNRAEAHSMLGYIAACQSDAGTAEREVALAMAQLRTTNKFDLWWNLGCVYAALSEKDQDHSAELQNIAMTMLENCVFQAQRTESRAAAVFSLRNDPALKPLHERKDFQDLIAPATLPLPPTPTLE